MEIENTQDPIYFDEDSSGIVYQSDFRITIKNKELIKQKSEEYYSRIRSKINKKSYHIVMKLNNLSKKMQQENLIGDFLFNNLNLSSEQQFAFINTEITFEDFLKNMQLLYILAKKIFIVVEHLFNGIIVRHKYMKYIIKLLHKILKVLNTFNTYFDPIEKGVLLNELDCNVELDEFEDQFLQKIDYYMRVVVKKKKAVTTEIIEVEDHTVEKLQFIENLPESIKKARIEAEKTSFNEFDHKKDQFKEEIKVINEDLKDLLQKQETIMPRMSANVQKLLESINSERKQIEAQEPANKISKDKDEFNEALFDGIDSSSAFINETADIKAAKLIQRFWRKYMQQRIAKERKASYLNIHINLKPIEPEKVVKDHRYSDLFTREASSEESESEKLLSNLPKLEENIKDEQNEPNRIGLFKKVVCLNSEILTKR